MRRIERHAGSAFAGCNRPVGHDGVRLGVKDDDGAFVLQIVIDATGFRIGLCAIQRPNWRVKSFDRFVVRQNRLYRRENLKAALAVQFFAPSKQRPEIAAAKIIAVRSINQVLVTVGEIQNPRSIALERGSPEPAVGVERPEQEIAFETRIARPTPQRPHSSCRLTRAICPADEGPGGTPFAEVFDAIRPMTKEKHAGVIHRR